MNELLAIWNARKDGERCDGINGNKIIKNRVLIIGLCPG
jgi:hypothetical protein